MVKDSVGLLEVIPEVVGPSVIVDEFTVTELVLSLVVVDTLSVIDETALSDSEAVEDTKAVEDSEAVKGSVVVVGISRVEL